ncbi:MAG: DUF1501 domain-containing protein [Mariniblastus sp.]|nr:DUF1501 domain-containing protein [Mariniblastus sp.]
MTPQHKYIEHETRRQFFRQGAMGLGGAALAALLGGNQNAFAKPTFTTGPDDSIGGIPGLPHFAPKAKRAIYLFMSGAPSQLDMYDYKPKMAEIFDTDLPESIRQGQRLTTMTSKQSRFPIAPSIFKFKKYDNGGDGKWVSELLPHTTKILSELAFIKSCHTEAINHDPAITYICTGNQLPGRASLGAWLSYGLGNENENLPAFIVLNSTWTGRKQAQALFNRLWGNGPLAPRHQGVLLRNDGDPVLFLRNAAGISPPMRRRMLDSLNQLNQQTHEVYQDPETTAGIAQYEMAFRMQSSVPELVDVSDESKATLDLYGPDVHQPGTFAYNCLLARRMAERGVRFTQIFHRGWDQHGNLPNDLRNQCQDIDRATYGLITDMKQRGLLDDTLVVWGGEFGRTIYCQGGLTKTNYGRDHHPRCYTMWMAGAGIKGGVVHGETDDFSYNVVQDPVHIRDINATILTTLGIDHERFIVKHQGLDQRLTGVEKANPIQSIMT